jgi:hypothetical protein
MRSTKLNQFIAELLRDGYGRTHIIPPGMPIALEVMCGFDIGQFITECRIAGL